MLSASDLGGLMAMMPAFATDNAADIRATATVDVGRLRHGLDRMIRDGADIIACRNVRRWSPRSEAAIPNS